MEKKYYLAYGSNLNIPQMRRRCPDAKIAGTALIDEYRLMYKGSGSGAYLTIEKDGWYDVPVAVWEVSEDDIKNLDIYEGFPLFYYKQEFTVTMEGIGERKPRQIKAFAYIMNEDRCCGIPTNRYVQTCLDGYTAFGFDKVYLEDALDYSIEEWRCDNSRRKKGT